MKSRSLNSKSSERKVVKKKKKPAKETKNSRKNASTSRRNNATANGSSNLSGVATAADNSEGNNDNNNNTNNNEDKDRRIQTKLRRRKSSSMSSGDAGNEENCANYVEKLRAWVDDYEVAVTNHYSPELRARVHAARINGVSADLKASTQGAVLGYRCKVRDENTVDYFQSKILVAATRLAQNTAIIEYQGKYLLASQWNNQQLALSNKYIPFTLQYRMPKEGLAVCVDARTYGNDARFTRRSCKPNAEVRYKFSV